MLTWFTTTLWPYCFFSSLVWILNFTLGFRKNKPLWPPGNTDNQLLYLVNAVLCLHLFMKVIDHLKSSSSSLISFEILPPLKGKGINALWDHLDPLIEFKPSFVNVTYHRSESMFKKKPDGTFDKVEVRKRPGTVGICAAIMNRYKVDAVAHLICGGFSRQETEDALIDLNFLGVDNVLVLRGDAPKNESSFEPEPGGHKYAIELLQQVMDMNNAIYLEEDLKNA